MAEIEQAAATAEEVIVKTLAEQQHLLEQLHEQNQLSEQQQRLLEDRPELKLPEEEQQLEQQLLRHEQHGSCGSSSNSSQKCPDCEVECAKKFLQDIIMKRY